MEQVKAGLIGPADLVWTEGMADWTSADPVQYQTFRLPLAGKIAEKQLQ